MYIIKKIFNKIIEETEEKKKEREEVNEIIETQKRVISNMKCPICGYTEFDKGYIMNNGTHGGNVSDISTYHNDYNKEYKNKVLVCSNCGYVLLFADFKTKTIIQRN